MLSSIVKLTRILLEVLGKGLGFPLGHWCSAIRSAYKNIQVGREANRNLSPDMIELLDKIGFQWHVVRPTNMRHLKIATIELA